MLIGHTLKGRYRVYDRVGRGGAADVYLARDVVSGQMVVVKLVHPHLVDDRFMARFEREIDLLRQVDSPYITRLYAWALRERNREVGETLSYIVTEFVEGHTLADIIDTRGKVEEKTALAITRQLALALGKVHALGIVHRDVKAQNIMITPDNDAKLIDFGIAKGPAHATLTDPAHFAGTLYYAPPEQIIASAKVDHRADLYALGVVLYEMLAARLPVLDKEFGTIATRIIEGKLDPLTDVSRPVADLVNAMLATDVEQRTGSAQEVVRQVEAIVGGDTDPGLPERPAPRSEASFAMRRAEKKVNDGDDTTQPVQIGKLSYSLKTDDGREIPLDRAEIVVGRSHPRDAVAPDVDLAALGVAEARTASRRHLRLFVENDMFFVEDLGSMNGTALNDEVLEPGNVYRMTPGDRISAGRVVLVFRVQRR